MNEEGQSSRQPGSKSPRAPSVSLKTAIDRTMEIYALEKLRSVPVSVAAKHMGYKTATSGASLTMIASLKYFGMIEKPKQGTLRVSNDVERYKYSQEAAERQIILEHWLKQPPIFCELHDRYGHHPPSIETVRYSLINIGFRPNSASSVAQAFLDSIEFITAEARSPRRSMEPMSRSAERISDSEYMASKASKDSSHRSNAQYSVENDGWSDRISIRLSGGRRAWLVLPLEFYSADKERIKAQLDVIVADDEN